MSRTSSAHGHSPAYNTFPDPWLSTTSDPEVSSFQAGAIRLTPTPASPHGNGQGSSPQDAQIEPIQRGYLSPNDNTNVTACVPFSDSVCIEPQKIELGCGSSNWDDGISSYKTGVRAGANGPYPAWSSPMAPSAFHWTSSEHNPTIISASTESESNGMQMSSQSNLGLYNVEPTRVEPSANQESTELDADATRGRSPVFKITTFSRGDSPQNDTSRQRCPSQSSTHLSADPNELEEGDETDSRPAPSTSLKRSNDGIWPQDPCTNLNGIGPGSRGNEYVPSPNDVHIHREREEKNEGIKYWSASVSEANSDAGGESSSPPLPRLHITRRLRARSTGDRPLKQEDLNSLQNHTKDGYFPGPGVLVYESSDELSDEESIGTYSGNTSAEVDEPARYDRSDPDAYLAPSPTKNSESIHLYPWHDPPRDSTPRSHAMQPDSSTDAMVAFERRARDLETASLAATVDNNSIFRVASTLEKFSLHEPKNQDSKHHGSKKGRGFLEQASSILRRQSSHWSLSQSSTYPPLRRDTDESQHKQSHSPRGLFSHRRHSRSPSLTNALMAMTSQIASVGGSQPVQAVSAAPSPNPERSPLNLHQFTGRGRSRSEIPQPSSAGLMNLMAAHGGPPVPNIASPRVSSDTDQTHTNRYLGLDAGDAENEQDVDMSNKKGVVMNFPAIQNLPVPTMEGFKSQLMQLNPRLEPALIHRLACEQDRRYKMLVGLRQTHSDEVANGSCKSGKFCFAQGGEEILLPDSKAPTETESGRLKFRVGNFTDGHEQGYLMGEGTAAAAPLPSGVPLPPVSRLPARFECPICFQVKTFNKPSDWSKHVQEDIQPFTCTFPHCNEPKSFKRKADWVRHENERHRHLEWWACAFPECTHKCFRKDNFVQHLVREHKMPEPKSKKGTAEVPNSQREQDVEQLWQMVEECRHNTEKPPQSEPCRFCGNVCSEWGKLSVHLAKHLEQLAMPVLRLLNPSSAPAPADQRRSAPLTHKTALQPQYTTPNTILADSELSMEPESLMEPLDHPYLGVGSQLAQAHPLPQNSIYPPPYASAPISPEPDVLVRSYPAYPVPQLQVYPADYQFSNPYTATYPSG